MYPEVTDPMKIVLITLGKVSKIESPRATQVSCLSVAAAEPLKDASDAPHS